MAKVLSRENVIILNVLIIDENIKFIRYLSLIQDHTIQMAGLELESIYFPIGKDLEKNS